MAIRGEEGKCSLFVRHNYFLSLQQLLSNFLNFLSITPNDDPLEKRRSLVATASPVTFLEGISQAGPGLPEL
jgi:hypothetical protein